MILRAGSSIVIFAAALALAACGSGADNAVGNAGTTSGEQMPTDTNGTFPDSYPTNAMGENAMSDSSMAANAAAPVGAPATTNAVSASGAAPSTAQGGAAGAPGQ